MQSLADAGVCCRNVQWPFYLLGGGGTHGPLTAKHGGLGRGFMSSSAPDPGTETPTWRRRGKPRSPSEQR